MKRRQFLPALGAVAAPLALGAIPQSTTSAAERHLIELRTYEITFGGPGTQPLLRYLTETLSPFLEGLGCPPLAIYKEQGAAEPANIWVLISYPSPGVYLSGQQPPADAAYDAIEGSKPVYNRFESQLLVGFEGMPTVADTIDGAGLFELRTYEGHSEDAVRRKVTMFNKEELPLFYEVGLTPLFFGEMIAGPYRPALVYMLQFTDMEAREAAWSKFGPHPKWQEMSAKPEYAGAVSNIRRVFLVPA